MMSRPLDAVPAPTNEPIWPSHEAELAVLRARVAQLEQESAEQKWMDDAIKALAFGTASATGQGFLHLLVRQLSIILKVQYVFVTEWVPGRTDRIRIVAGWSGDRAADPIEYELHDTPCQKVFQDGEAFFPHRVQQLFPQDKYLVEYKIESYMGVSLLNSSSRPIGHLCIMDVCPFLFDSRRGSAILRVFAARAAAELERLRAEETLRESEQAIRALQEATSKSDLTLDQRIQTVLELGCRHYNLPIGVLTKLEGEHLKLTHVWAPGTAFNVGMSVPLSRTYCSAVVHRDDLLCFEYAGASEWRSHPGYQTPGLECYIGARLAGRRQIHGTICFMGPEPRSTRFTEADKDFLLLMARWISEELDRWNSENALKEQEALLRSVIDTAIDAIFMKDRDGHYQFINSAGALVIGRPPQEIIGKNDLELFPADTASRLMADDREVFSGAVKRRFEEVIPLKGESRTFYTIKSPHRDQSGQVVGLVGVARDMTDVKRAEEALRLTQIAVDRSADFAFWIDASARFLYVNETACQRLGYSREELLTMTVADVDPDYQMDTWPRYWEELHQAGRLRFESRHRTKSGETFPVEVLANFVTAEGREYNFAFMRDISERRRAEAALRASELRLHRFVAEAPVGLVIFDEDKRVINANKAFCELTGYAEHEILGTTYELYTHPEDLPVNLTLTDEFYRGVRSEYTLEKRYIRKSGEIIWVSVKAGRVELPGHPGPLKLSAIQDITEQKLAMEERERLSQDLHDNILQSLYAVGMQLEAGKLVMGKSPRQSKAHMTQAIDQLNHLMLDVRQFITLLTQQTPAKLDFGQALRQLVASLSPPGRAVVDLEIKDPVLSLITPRQGEQLLNITRESLSNTMRHGQATHRSVRLSHTGNKIRLVICDDGIGFPARRRRHRGHGLANMAARAKKIRARFTLDSAPGKGTCITVEVPVEKGPARG